MFIKTIKLRDPLGVLLAGIIVLAAVAVTGLWLMGRSGMKEYRLETEEERQVFLSDMGWEVGEAPERVKTVTIPEEWNEVYESYNELQKQQGFDLSRYKGLQAEIYTYSVTNYPDRSEGVVCDLIVCDGLLIGGDVCSIALDGFMQGLRR